MAGFAFGLLAIMAGDARAVSTFTVDSIADDPDTDIGDGLCNTAAGDCTLRAAIQEANGGKLVDIIAGGVDVNRDGTVDTFDDLVDVVLVDISGVADQVDIVNGGVDVDESGTVDAADDLFAVDLRLDDGSTNQVDVLDGGVDVDQSGTVTVADDLTDVWLALDAGDTDQDTIKFDLGIFTSGSPGTITPGSSLPVITEDLTIDAIDRGVILSGTGLVVKSGNSSGIDFELLGGSSTFEIQGAGTGINICGDDVSVNDDDTCDAVSLDGVVIDGVDIGTTSTVVDGIDVSAVNLISVSVTNSEIVADDDGIYMLANGGSGDALGNNTVTVTGNVITGNDVGALGYGVDLQFDGDLSSTITATVSNNGDITAIGNGTGSHDGVQVHYCSSGGCDVATGSTINVDVDNNASITGAGSGVDVFLDADDGGATGTGTDSATLNVSVDDNKGTIEGLNSDAVSVVAEACCSTSDNDITVTVDGNQDITAADLTGTDIGVDVLTTACCGDDNGSSVSVSNNRDITGSDDAVKIRSVAGIDGDPSSNNTSTVHVDNNRDLTGDHDDGVDIFSTAGFGSGEGDNNDSTVTVSGNRNITGEVNGVYVDSEAGTIFGDGDNNTSSVTVSLNGTITSTNCCGDPAAVDITATAKGDAAFTSSGNEIIVAVTGNDDILSEDGQGVVVDGDVCCDSGASTVTINDNANITGDNSGGSEDAVDVDVYVCCETSDSTSTVSVNGNNDLTGGDDGVWISSDVCCGDGNTSTVTVSNNRDVLGRGSDGVVINSDAGSVAIGDSSASSNNTSTVTVSGNRDITGVVNEGVEVDARAGTGSADNGDNNDTSVTVANNRNIRSDASGSSERAIELDVASGGELFSADGADTGSTGNSTTVTVTGNNDITTDGGEAIRVGSLVCCDNANTNVVTISENTGKITGGDDAIDIDGTESLDFVCCSENTITITDNAGKITGGTAANYHGIEIEVCAEVEIGPTSDTACISGSHTTLTISGNDISESDGDGINLTAGDWSGSVISGNTIKNNTGNGILISSASGITIGPDNVITGNGPSAGINIVEVDLGSGIVQADGNTITRNSIFDNGALGIDLDDDGFGGGSLPAPCTGLAETPNNCLKAPSLNQLVGTKLIGIACGNCTVELFVADNIPADQFGYGEGKTFIISGTADVLGDFSINLCETPAGLITATATNATGSTSEFSENLAVIGTTDACATPTVTPGPSPTPADTATPGPTVTPAVTPTVTPTPTVTATATATTTATPAVTDTPVATDTPTATDTPPPTATNTPTDTPVIPATPGNTFGDVNKNGVVNAIDVSLILQAEAGFITLANPKNADVNQDGTVDSRDAALIMQFIAGLIPSLPA